MKMSTTWLDELLTQNKLFLESESEFLNQIKFSNPERRSSEQQDRKTERLEQESVYLMS